MAKNQLKKCLWILDTIYRTGGISYKREFGIICPDKLFHSGHVDSGDLRQVSILEDVLFRVSTSVPEDELSV